MIELLAQAVPVVAEASTKIFGLSVVEWSILLGALATFLEAMRQRHGKARGGLKVQAIVEALEEVQEAHPEAVRLAKSIAKSKATKMGVEVSSFGLDGLEDDVHKSTRRFKKKESEK
jgi:hypothetical protein